VKHQQGRENKHAIRAPSC